MIRKVAPRVLTLIACLVSLGVVITAKGIDSLGEETASGRHEIKLNGHTFTLPTGFEIELVAGPPLVDRPITASFDEEGRLYVSDSSGSNDKIDKQLAEKPHRILRLEDTDGDGRFDKSTVFADKMMFPEGTMWFDGSLYVAAPPSIWKLTDSDGDGVADKREEWFPGKTLTGCANDLHGPYAGPDGWIYWCKGAFAKQTYERVGKSLRVIPELPLNILGKEVPVGVAGAESSKPKADAGTSSRTNSADGSGTRPQPPNTWSTRASHIFRCRPDGSGLEVVMTGGMDNPVDVVFTPGGDRILTNTFLVHPGGGLRDGLIHAVYGGVYGKPWDVIEDHKRTGDVIPPLAHLGAAAPCGLTSYESRVFGPEYQNNLFACCFNMHKISRHVLEPHGASFKSRDEDFLVSDNLDFHPTDILEDADGSLIVVDTGGWYKLCCPTSQLQKPDVLGAIYRVRRSSSNRIAGTVRRGSPNMTDPRGLKLAWAKLTTEDLTHKYLADDRPAVRDRAIRELVKRGETALTSIVEASRVPSQAELRRNAVWTLSRIDHADARAAIRAALSDRDETVRQVALHSVSLWRDHGAMPQLVKLLQSGSPHNRRVAAEAIGRIGDKSAVPALLAAAPNRSTPHAPRSTDAPDRFLEHALTYALIEIADPNATALGLESTEPLTRRVALIAVDQMDGGGLDPLKVASLLSSSDPVLKETASWIVSRHADWGESLAGYLRERLANQDLTDADRTELQRQLALMARTPAIQELLAASLHPPLNSRGNGRSGATPTSRIALGAMRDSELKEMPKLWLTALTHLLYEGDPELLVSAVSTVRSVPLPKDGTAELVAGLLKIARRSDLPAPLRLDSMASVPGGLAVVDPELFDFLRANLGVDTPVATRSAAASVLARAKLATAQLESLTDSLKDAGPLELGRLLEAFEQSADETVGRKLVASLKESSALTALRADSIQRSLAKCGPAVQEQAQSLYAAIHVDVAKQKERLEDLLDSTKDGDIRRGQAVFMSAKAICSACHQLGYLGGNIGPDLTRIGGIRNERDLLESIAFPSASFVRSYEPVVVATKDGRIFSGNLKKDAPDEIILAINATETVRIARDDIDELRPGTVSVMPSGLDQQLTRQELADLIAFLKAAK